MRRLLYAAGLLVLAGAARGEPPPGVKPIRVELHPAAVSVPVLRYALLPPLRDQKPGNAVPHYRDAIMSAKEEIKGLDDKKWYEKLDRWTQTPLDRLPRDELRKFLQAFETSLDLADRAARHEFADWELTEKLRKMGIATLLPDVQPMREFGTYLSLRSRLAMAEGRLDDAHRDLQTMLAIGRDTAHAPVLICDLVGLAIGSVATSRLDDFVQCRGAPNLYWALTDLPQPFVDLRLALQGERIAGYGTFRDLPLTPADAAKVMTPEQIQQAVKMAEGLQRTGDFDLPRPVFQVQFGLDLQRKHERAKQALVAAGWPRAAVEKMPHVEVGLIQGFLDLERYLDECERCCNLPYLEAAPALLENERKSRLFHGVPRPDQPAIPLASVLGPSMIRVLFVRTRLERKIAALRCLEALRLYAAGHDGKLPARLADIKEVAIPVDPYTGKPFDYEAAGNEATLSAPALSLAIIGRKPVPQDALYYEIVMKR